MKQFLAWRLLAWPLLLFTVAWCIPVHAADKPPTVPLAPDDIPQPLVSQKPRSEAEHDRIAAEALFAHGRVLFQREEFGAALRRYQRAWRYQPSAVSILREIVPLAVELERNEEASRYAVIAAESDPRDEGLLRRLAVFLAERDDYARALKLFEKSLELHQDPRPEIGTVLLRLEMGRLYFLIGKYAPAAEHLQMVRQALAEPAKFNLTEDHRKLLLGKPEATYTLLTEVFFQAGKFDEADEQARRLHEAQPNAALLAFHQARTAAGRQHIEAALKLLDEYFQAKVAAAGPDPYELLAQLLARKLPDAATAQRQLREKLAALHENDPGNAPLALALAAACRAAKEYERSEKLYQEQLQLRPLAEAYRGLLALAREQKQPEKLLRVLGEAVAAEGNLEVISEEAGQLVEQKELTAELLRVARERLRAEAGKYPPGAPLAVALVALDAKEFVAASEFFELALAAQGTKKSQVLLSWGLGLFLGEQYSGAAEVFERAIRERALPENPAHVHFLLANALEFAGRTEAALAAAAEAVKLRPEMPRYLGRVAWIHYHARQLEQAEKAYRELIEKFDANYKSPEVRDEMREARLVLSHIQVLKGNIPAAQEWLEQVLDEYPEDIGAQNDLSFLWSERGQHLERSLRMAQNAVRGDPKNEAYLDTLGWAYFRLGQYAEAIVELEKAAAQPKPDGTILDHLGDAYLKHNQPEKARAAWQRAVDAFREAKENDKIIPTENKLKSLKTP